MPTARSPTVRVSWFNYVSVEEGGGSKLNKFEHVREGQSPVWGDWGALEGAGSGAWFPSLSENTHTTENITFPQLRWRVVINVAIKT